MKLILGLFLSIFLLACSSDNHKENHKIFKYNESAGISSLDPAFAKDQANIWATTQLFNGLVQLDKDLAVQPAIAKRWDITADGKIYTFYLRTDVLFHQHELLSEKERIVTAHDFVYSFNITIICISETF